MLTEENLLELGFNRVNEDDEEDPYYYYELEITEKLCLLSNGDDEAKKDGWLVYIFSSDELLFTDYTDLKNIIDIFKRSMGDRT